MLLIIYTSNIISLLYVDHYVVYVINAGLLINHFKCSHITAFYIPHHLYKLRAK